MQEIKAIAKKTGVRTARLRKAELVQTIQKTEGNNACFSSLMSNQCGQDNCLWRKDCLFLDKKAA